MADAKKTSTSANNSGSATKSAEQHARNAAGALDAKLSGPLAPLEKSLSDAFGEKASYQLPKEFKELLVKIAPFLAIIGGVLGLVSAYNLWNMARRVNSLVGMANEWAETLGVSRVVDNNGLTMSVWLAIGSMVIVSILSLLAFPGLNERKKVGWNLMFYALLVNIIHSVLTLFTDGDKLGSFVMTVIVSLIGLYVVFQLRSYYIAKK